MVTSPHVIDVQTSSFKEDVIDRSHEVPVVVDFWAPWCGPCQVLGPVLEELADEGDGTWVLAKLDTDQNPQLAADFGIRGIPNVKAFVNGKVVHEFSGALPRPSIEQWLAQILPSEAEQLLASAKGLEQSGDTDGARELYETLLRADATNPGALIGMARIAAQTGEKDAARQLIGMIPEVVREQMGAELAGVEFALELGEIIPMSEARARVDADSTDLEARLALGKHLAAQGRYEEGLEQLLQVVIRDRDFGEDAGRETMIRIFHLIGINEPMVRKWQGKLGRAMYV